MKNYAEVIDAYDKGRYYVSPFRKVRATSASYRADMGYGAGTPSNTSIVYSMGKVVSVSNTSGTTTLNRDAYGNLISVTFPDHTKTFTIVDGVIAGYIVS